MRSPAPWNIRETWYDTVEDAEGLMVADVCGVSREIAEANARLIAAAPDLLEALKQILVTHDWEVARAAIAKVEGTP